MRILPRRPSNSITHSAKPTAGDVISSRNAGGALDRVRRSPTARAFCRRRFTKRFGSGLADSSSRFSLPYSKRKAWRWGKPRAPEPVPRLRPTGARESASGPCARSATARNGGKPSACRGEYWETAWSSSVLLVSASERPTLATTARSSHAGLPKGHRATQSPHIPTGGSARRTCALGRLCISCESGSRS